MTDPTDQLPTFRTPRLILRPRHVSDVESCLTMDRDPLVTQFIDGPWSDPVAHRAFVKDRINRHYPPGMGYWSILAPSFVGWILLAPLDLHGPEIEFGWRLVRAAWGRGYATEAARPVLGHALDVLGLPRVVADIDLDNAASIGVAGDTATAERAAILQPGSGQSVANLPTPNFAQPSLDQQDDSGTNTAGRGTWLSSRNQRNRSRTISDLGAGERAVTERNGRLGWQYQKGNSSYGL